MADDSNSVPSIPGNTNWSEWTFEQALAAITGEGADLHSAAQATWYNFNTSPGAGDNLNYHAFGDYYFGVDFNSDAQNKWWQVFDTIDGMMNDVAKGKRGDMDLQTLRDLEMAIRGMAVWTDGTAGGMHSWSNALNQDDSSFKGKAAFIIQWRLKAAGDGLVDTHEQLTTRHGLPIADAVGSAASALEAFNTTMVNTWHGVNGLRQTVVDHLNYETKAAFDYMKYRGIFHDEPNYYLDSVSTDDAKAYIKRVMTEYPQFGGPGALDTADGWAAIGRKVTNDVTAILKGWLDPPAQTALGTLQPVYLKATSALVEITAPPKETPPSPDPNKDGGGGDDDANLPPPPGGDGGGDNANIPPPPGGGDGGGDNANIPPPGGGGDGGGDLGLDGPPGSGGDGGGDVNLAGPPGSGGDGGGDLGLDGPPGSGADGGGNNAFVPNLVPPPGGGPDADGGGSNGGPGPGSDGAFDETGGGDGVIAPPGGDPDGGGSGSLLSPDTGKSGTNLPPGLDAPGGGADGSGSGFDIGDGSDGGFGSDPANRLGTGGDPAGGGFGGVGLGPGGLGSSGVPGGLGGPGSGFDIGSAGGGAGGLGGGLGAGGGAGGLGSGGGFGGSGNGSLPTSMQASGGSPGAPGSPGSTGGNTGGDGGGVPFFPPMMGGGGGAGGGDKPQERERQTWLSEDEEIWGTSVEVGSGVIGRLEEEEFELEEAALLGPVRGQRRGDTPRRPRPSDKEATPKTESTGEETTGAASAT